MQGEVYQATRVTVYAVLLLRYILIIGTYLKAVCVYEIAFLKLTDNLY